MRYSCVLRCNTQRTIGYGPFSITARPCQTLQSQVEQNEKNNKNNLSNRTLPKSSSPNLMRNVQLQTNLNLRRSLSNLEHPSLVATMPYRSEQWRLAMCRLYRTILRLHNKTVAVSVDRARSESPQSAIAAETGIANITSAPNEKSHTCLLTQKKASTCDMPEQHKESTNTSCESEFYADHNKNDDYMLRYLLNDEQRAFGNFFVHSEFTNHIDADALAASAFYSSWYDYVCSLASGITSRDLTEAERQELTDEQQERLRTLHTQLISLQNPFHSASNSAEGVASFHRNKRGE